METRDDIETTFPTPRPAGWYNDPDGKHSHQAYWDGDRWTGDTRPDPDVAGQSVGTTSAHKLTESEVWFSYQGRIGAGQYWGRFLIGSVGFVLLAILASAAAAASGDDGIGNVFLLLPLGMIWPSSALATKRLHDQNKAGAAFLVVLIPIIGNIIWLVWSLSRGTTGPNRYGPSTGYR